MATIIKFPKTIGTTNYCPEMGQEKPLADTESKISYGGKWRIKTRLELKGRGIKYHDTLENGKHIYYCTDLAYNKLEQQYSISYEELLD